jgi:GDSL-like Lipase/Acylhydrolase family
MLDRRKVMTGSVAAGACAGFTERARGTRGAATPHIVLLGDSVFDNAAYVGDGPDVIRQLRSVLSKGSRATLRAVDGATIAGVAGQLARLPRGATHLVVSVGGNDALREAGVLQDGAASVAGALLKIAAVRERFERDYREMLDVMLGRNLPSAVCTIYEARFPEAERRKVAATALAVLNDAITREAFARALPLIDLRLICESDADFANPIEPSVSGGAKIARAIARFAVPDRSPRSEVFAR